ncbi:uncharacterized DUF497 family protein [Luteibacter sp. HA06]
MALTFEWDAAKARKNSFKHSVSFAQACDVFSDLSYIDIRHHYHGREVRFAAVGLANGRELFVVYTLRGQTIRLISAREANRHESLEYWKLRHLRA